MKASSAWIAIGMAFLGCSSSSGGSGGGGSESAASCGKVAACGGDIVGTWKVVAACSNGSSATPSNSTCPGETDTSSVTASGTATFKSDMTYTVDFIESDSETIVVPASCLSSNGVTVTCDDLSVALSTGQGDAGVMTTCTTSGSSCSCALAVAGVTANETGTYTVSGSTFTTTPTGGSASTGDYCVQGNTLHVISTATGGAMGMPATDVVGTRE